MPLDDRFEDLVASLTGFYRAWVIQLGIELGLFARLREAGANGLTRAELAAAAKAAGEPISAWCDAAYAADLIADDGRRVTRWTRMSRRSCSTRTARNTLAGSSPTR